MLKIKKLTIENFRGIKLPLSLDFVKGKNFTSVVLYGRNGTGKSSIVDAWEWLNTSQIQSLSREGVSASDFPHKLSKGKDCNVAAEFQHATIGSIQATFNPKKITAPTFTGQYNEFRQLSTYPNYLRFSDLQEFVYKTRAERYRYIAKFFGLEAFTLLQDTIQAAIGKLIITLQNHEQQLDGNTDHIKSITGGSVVDEAAILAFINTLAKKYETIEITDFNGADGIKTRIETNVKANPVTRELTEWQSFQKKQNQFYPLTSLKASATELEKVFKELKADEESIKQLVLSELYRQGEIVVPTLADPSVCPLCDNPFVGDLLDHIKTKHAKLDALKRKKQDFETRKTALEKQLTQLSGKIAAIQSEESSGIRATFKTFFNDLDTIGTSLQSIGPLLKKGVVELDKIEISKDPFLALVDAIIAKEATLKKIVSDKIAALSTDVKSRTLAQDFNNLTTLIKSYKEFLINQAKVKYLKTIHEKLTAFHAHLLSFIQKTIQSTFSNISSNVVDYFNILEGSNRFLKNPSLKLISGKDKAIELEIEFATEKVQPAFKVMSESQVNSFGLAIFLGAVRHFNVDFKFFILDDVVSSFDAFKRPLVAQLLATKFSDFQILLFTHDQIFFETIYRSFPQWQRYKITSWDYTTGPDFKSAKNYVEEINQYLDDDKPLVAGQTLGVYLERMLADVNERMQTPIKYKMENIYTLAEFYDPAVARFKSKLKLAGKQHKLIAEFDSIDQGVLFRNYCAHYKNPAHPFTTPEIKTVAEKWFEIEKLLFCPECVSFAKFDSSTGTEYIKCDCGRLDLKAAMFYA